MNASASPYLNASLPISGSIYEDHSILTIKRYIWVYLLLVFFEGALRKWFLPSLAGPLLVIRDPLTMAILYLAWKNGSLKLNYFVISMFVIGFFGVYTAFFLGHGNLYVALFGARILVLHLPLIFVIGQVLTIKDVEKIGRFVTIITIPMTMLIIMQFYSPQTAWINKSVGGEAGGGFSGAMNFFRPPGTFSFTNGNTLFYSFSACFIINFWFNRAQINRLVLLAATIALLLSIPFSISRGLLFQVLISLGFAVIYALTKPKYTAGMILILGLLIGVVFMLSYSPYFTTATAAFSSRYENANTVEGGLNGVLLDRFLGGMIGAITTSSNQPFFGYGIGMGTNVGSMLLSGGRIFLISEGEWGRLIGELGPVVGLTVIFMRLKLAFSLIVQSLKRARMGVILPWMLASFSALSIAQAGLAQPTSLGFCVLITGLTLASLKSGALR